MRHARRQDFALNDKPCQSVHAHHPCAEQPVNLGTFYSFVPFQPRTSFASFGQVRTHIAVAWVWAWRCVRAVAERSGSIVQSIAGSAGVSQLPTAG